MPIKYELAPDIQEIINEIAILLYPHVKLHSVVCIRSFGSTSRGTIARCYALGKAMQLALNRKGFYVIEVISKRFDKLSSEDKLKTLIHELMHIPKSFGGGFRHHDYVCEENIEIEYQKFLEYKKPAIQETESLLDQKYINFKQTNNKPFKNNTEVKEETKKSRWW